MHQRSSNSNRKRSVAYARTTRHRFVAAAIGALVAVIAPARPNVSADWRFTVKFSPTVHDKPYTGRVYLFFSRTRRQPRHDPNWFHPEKFVARDVVNWKPNESLEFSNRDNRVLAYPSPSSKIDPNGDYAQAVVRFNPFERKIGDGPGNGYSQVVIIGDGPSSPEFVVDRLTPSPRFPETAWRKEIQVHSKLLSDFYGRDVSLKAAVLLPSHYDAETSRRYPTIFTVPGFGGTHYPRPSDSSSRPASVNGVDFLRVLLDPRCPLGHHVFADSANNGPVGQALVSEFLPAFDRAYRSIADPRARFLTGHSSGGWSTLWLQITYPEYFGGTWSTSPDPVDFRDFQLIDLYQAGANLYVDASGHERPLARFGDKVVLTFRGFAQMEDLLGPGGQLHSFETVFSPRGPDGAPRRLWDRKTGAIDTAVAKSWEKYDIRLVLERRWKTLAPNLAGKIHVFTGSDDTFYLDGAVRLLKDSLRRLGSDAVIEIHEGKDHFTLLNRNLTKRIQTEMAAAYYKAFPSDTSTKH